MKAARFAPHLAVLLAVLGLASPLLRAPAGSLIGWEQGQVWRVLWTWQAATAPLFGEGSAHFTPLLQAPFGAPFLSPSPLLDLVGGLLLRLLGEGPAWNLLLFGGLLTGGLGLARLARQEGLDAGASTFAALSYTLHPYVLSAVLACGATEGLTWALLPWVAAAALRLRADPRPPRVLPLLALSALLLGLDLESWTGLALALPLLALGPANLRPGGRSAGLLLLAGLAALGLLLSILVPPLLRDPLTLLPPSLATQGLLPSAAAVPRLGYAMAAVDGYFFGGSRHLLLRPAGTLLYSSTYLGWTALLLALGGAGRGRLRWLALGLGAGLLATGPWLLITLDAWRPWPVPWWTLLRALLPPAAQMSGWVRLVAWVALAVALLAGHGLARARSALPGRRGLLPALIAPVLLLAELFTLSPASPRLPVAAPLDAAAAAQARGEGALLDWPALDPAGQRPITRYLAEQRHHGRPLALDLDGGTGRLHLDQNPLFTTLEGLTRRDDAAPPPAGLPEATAAAGQAELWGLGYRSLRLHPDEIDPQRLPAVEAWLDDNLKRQALLSDGSVIYALRPRD